MKGVSLTTRLLFKIVAFIVVAIIVIVLAFLLKEKSLDVFDFAKDLLG